MKSLAILLLLSATAVAGAPAPSAAVVLEPAGRLEAPSVVRRDQPQRINHAEGAVVQAIYVDASGEWAFLPDRHFVREQTFTILAAPPATYLLTTGDSTILRIIGGDDKPNPRPRPQPRPDPTPDPQPDPNPGPIPIVAKWAIWVEEQDDRAQNVEATQVMTDAKLRKGLEDRGLQVRIYDDDQTEPHVKRVVEAAGSTRPAFLLIDKDGVTRAFPAPKTADALEKIIRENVVR